MKPKPTDVTATVSYQVGDMCFEVVDHGGDILCCTIRRAWHAPVELTGAEWKTLMALAERAGL